MVAVGERLYRCVGSGANTVDATAGRVKGRRHFCNPIFAVPRPKGRASRFDSRKEIRATKFAQFNSLPEAERVNRIERHRKARQAVRELFADKNLPGPEKANRYRKLTVDFLPPGTKVVGNMIVDTRK